MATKFLYTSPEGLILSQSTEELMLVVDNFQYDVLKPDFSSFGEIHDTLEIRLVSTPDIKKRTIHLTLGFLRDNLKRMKEYNERIASENKAIYEKIEKTRDESLCRYLKKEHDTSVFKNIVNQHIGEDDSVVVTLDASQKRLGYYTRENDRGLIVLVKTRDENQMVATLIHEYIHAWADKNATGSMNDAEYAEEEIAEYGMLHFLQTIAGHDDRFHQILLDAINNVEDKKGTSGLVHYGFGAELYYNYAHVKWERLLRDAHTLTGPGMPAYKELKDMLQTYPEKSDLNKVANLLYEVLITKQHAYSRKNSIYGSNNSEDELNSSNQPSRIFPESNILAPVTSTSGKLIGQFIVAGLIYNKRAQDLKSLNVKDIIRAEHELNNPNDENAVRLFRPDGRELGYVPMYKKNAPRNLHEIKPGIPLYSATVAYMLDHQLPLTFVISNMNASKEYKERWVEIEVYGN